ncbi:extracellular solute-binding protein [Dinghuibacter silviterrae]|uniref:Multiple sugar transport system substrate-binding protein n=1 Tax=Dinghuibacter silviterrae TaxID=1539049 RepID=A0A4R8DTW9_9BACT|nr:extracellular solute-binding protein [Dinghuibacter silviterrae]TDX01368.1 multiple sugar transport system substrate-binding protein [Dinghuibacter silviterrae]
MPALLLKGITWSHSRGVTPLLAAAQRFSELFPDVSVTWTQRSLQEFADKPLEALTEQYDLLVIDHPWVGRAAATGCVLPLDTLLPAAFLEDQARHSTGDSHPSYRYDGHQWALALDAATPVASYRQDLLDRHQVSVPGTWNEVLALARRGKVAVPAIPIDILMNFYMFCIAHGALPFQCKDEVVDRVTGLVALETMQELYGLLDKKMFQLNPIGVAEVMTRTDDFWYCPFAYGYSNYTRRGYARTRLTYADLVALRGNRLRSTIGGTGLAISTRCIHMEEALAFAQWVTSGECQSTFYLQHGGQPAHRSAWVDAEANRLCNDYFRVVLPAMERGYTRPRYDGYLFFQDHGGDPLREALMGKRRPASALDELNEVYRRSLAPENVHA